MTTPDAVHMPPLPEPDYVPSGKGYAQAYAAQRTADLEARLAAAEGRVAELTEALTGLHKCMQIALEAKSGKQHANLETMSGSFICMSPVMQSVDAVLAYTPKETQ